MEAKQQERSEQHTENIIQTSIFDNRNKFLTPILFVSVGSDNTNSNSKQQSEHNQRGQLSPDKRRVNMIIDEFRRWELVRDNIDSILHECKQHRG